MTAHPKKSESIEVREILTIGPNSVLAKWSAHDETDQQLANILEEAAQSIEALYNQRMVDELRSLRLDKFVNHVIEHGEYCVPVSVIDDRILEIRTRAGINKKEHICTGGVWNNETKQFECDHVGINKKEEV